MPRSFIVSRPVVTLFAVPDRWVICRRARPSVASIVRPGIAGSDVIVPRIRTRWPTEMSAISMSSRTRPAIVTAVSGPISTSTSSLNTTLPDFGTIVAPRTSRVSPLRATTLPRTAS